MEGEKGGGTEARVGTLHLYPSTEQESQDTGHDRWNNTEKDVI